MRSPVTILASFLIAFLGSLLLVPSLFDLSPWAKMALEQAQVRENVRVASYENIDVRLLPSPSITFTAGELKFKGAALEPRFESRETEAHSKWQSQRFTSLRLNFSLFDLIVGKLIPHHVEAAGLTFSVVPSDLTAVLREGPVRFPDISFSISESLMLIDVSDREAPMQLTNVAITADIQGSLSPVNLAMSFDYEGIPFMFNAVSARPSAMRMPLVISLKAEPAVGLEFDGFVARSRAPEISGEFTLTGSRLLAPLLNSIGFEASAMVDQNLSLRGLLFANATGIQTDNVRFRALGQDAAMQVNVDFAQNPDDDTDRIFMRLTADQFDVSGVSFNGNITSMDRLPFADALGLLFSKPPQLDAAIRIDSLMINGEAVSNIVGYVGFENDGLRLNQIRADFPFGSSLFLSGNVDLKNIDPVFDGSMSANSSDAKQAIYWLFDAFDVNLDRVRKIMDTSGLQRLGLSADIRASKDMVNINNLIGHIDGDKQSLNVTYTLGQNKGLNLKWSAPHMDVAKWGLLDSDLIPRGETSLLGFPLDEWVNELLVFIPKDIAFSVQVSSEDFNVGSVRLGALISDISVRDEQVSIKQLALGNFDGANLSISGTLAHDRQYAYGDLEMSIDAPADSALTRQLQNIASPFKVAIKNRVQFKTQWGLTQASDPKWPSMTMSGRILSGDLAGQFAFFSPSRDFSLVSKDTELKLSLAGPSQSLLLLLTGSQRASNLTNPPANEERQEFEADHVSRSRAQETSQDGRLVLTVASPNNQVASVAGEIRLWEDSVKISGLLRGVGNARQIEGTTTIDIVNIGTYLGWDPAEQPISVNGNANTTLSPNRYVFSALDALFGGGNVAGEGVYIINTKRPNLTANLTFSDLDLMPFMPSYKDGWSSTPLAWSLLGLADANLELKLENVSLNKLDFASAKGRVRLVDGVIEVSDLETSIAGGTILANLNIEGGNLLPSITVDARVEEIELARITQSLFRQQLIEAPLSGSFSLRGRGRSSLEFMTSLAGTFNLDVGKGRLQFINVDALTKPLSILQGAVATVTPAPPPPVLSDYQGQTEFSNILMLLALKDGLLQVDQAEFLGGSASSLALRGGVNILSRGYSLDLFIPKNIDEQLELQIGGNMMEPSISVALRPMPDAN